MKFKTIYNAEVSSGEKNVGPSMTIPDQTMSISEMILRHTKGLPISGARIPLYGEEAAESDIGRMELTDKMELLAQAKKDVERLRQELNQRAHEKQTALLEQSIRKRIEAERKIDVPDVKAGDQS